MSTSRIGWSRVSRVNSSPTLIVWPGSASRSGFSTACVSMSGGTSLPGSQSSPAPKGIGSVGRKADWLRIAVDVDGDENPVQNVVNLHDHTAPNVEFPRHFDPVALVECLAGHGATLRRPKVSWRASHVWGHGEAPGVRVPSRLGATARGPSARVSRERSVGYGRVSTRDQNREAQQDALRPSAASACSSTGPSASAPPAHNWTRPAGRPSRRRARHHPPGPSRPRSPTSSSWPPACNGAPRS